MARDEEPAPVADLTPKILAQIRDATRETVVGLRDVNARLDQTNARVDRLADVVTLMAARVDESTPQIGALTAQVAENTAQIRALAAVMESGSRQTAIALGARAEVTRVEALEARVERLELKLAVGE